jgi:hypothetical protein
MIVGPNPSLLQTKRDPFVSGAPKPNLRVKVTVIISSIFGSKSCNASAVGLPLDRIEFTQRKRQRNGSLFQTRHLRP